jgi:hypothetical protein
VTANRVGNRVARPHAGGDQPRGGGMGGDVLRRREFGMGGGRGYLEHLHEDHGDFVGLGVLGERGLELVQHSAHVGHVDLRRREADRRREAVSVTGWGQGQARHKLVNDELEHGRHETKDNRRDFVSARSS